MVDPRRAPGGCPTPAHCAVLGLVLAACGDPPTVGIIDPFPRIEMNGTWAIRTLARSDGADPPTDPGVEHEPFRPLHEGMMLVVADNRIRDRGGEPLFAAWNAAVANQRYTNSGDGRNLVFDFADSGALGCTWHEEVSGLFTALDDDLMAGTFVVVSISDCTDPEPLPSEATGQFQIVLERIARPADAPMTAAPTDSVR